MKKLLKWTSITLGILILLLIAAALALTFSLPLEKIKDFAAAKLAESIQREVKLKSVSFNLFSGIKLNELDIGNHKAFTKKTFISAKTIELKYAFWPLFKRRLIIHEIRLVKPVILVEKNKNGILNYADLIKIQKPAMRKEAKGAPFSLLVNRFSLSAGKLTYLDQASNHSTEIKNLEVSVSDVISGFTQPINFRASATAVYKEKDIPLSLAGKAKIDLAKEKAEIFPLSFSLAGEAAASRLAVSSWKNGPRLDFLLDSPKLSLDPLLAIFGSSPAGKKTRPAQRELTENIHKAVKSIPAKLSLHASINLNHLSLRKFKVEKINLTVKLSHKKLSADVKEIKIYDGRLSGKVSLNLNTSGLGYAINNLKLTDFNASPFSNAVVETFLTKFENYPDLINKVYGTLNVSCSLNGQGVEISDILKNLAGSGSFSLSRGELKRLKTIDSIAEKIKAPGLKQNLSVTSLSAEFNLKDQILNIKNLDFKDHDIQAKFRGSLDLNKLKYLAGNRLTLRASPQTTQGLDQAFKVFRDQQGWFELDFELKGDLQKPLPYPLLDKPLEAATEKIKAGLEEKKVELEQKVKTEIRKKEEEAQKAAAEKKEELKKEVKEKAKEQLKEIFKF